MSFANPSDSVIRDVLTNAKTIAVVGCSPDPSRTSHQIAAIMQKRGYRIIPVHPDGGEILGEKVYASLLDIPKDISVDIVDVFRRSEFTPPIANDAVAIKAKCLWLQQGVLNEEVARIAEAAHMVCVQDLCIKVLHSLLRI